MFREMNGKELESVLGGKKYKVQCWAQTNGPDGISGNNKFLGYTELPGVLKKQYVNSVGASQCRQWALDNFGVNGGSQYGARTYGRSRGANGKGWGPQVDVVYF
ncbi:hypothetical protein [Shewanella japonica]|uniref:hypothetical protein n=1 Tax=Shewanella japonica TaxID=93973 RepID=UPI000E70A846|nr:hypothetical protein [Shewanella japonica]